MVRPKLNRSVDEAIAARKASRSKSKAKSKNVTLDNDALLALYKAQDILKNELGFQPTLSQTVHRAVILLEKKL